MILRRLEPRHFGPFATSTILEVEDEITVLTGSNDTGKTSLLRLIARVCDRGTGGVAAEYDANIDRLNDIPQGWDADAELGCVATFICKESGGISGGGFGGSPTLSPGDEIDLDVGMAPKARKLVLRGIRKVDGSVGATPQAFPHAFPTVVWLPTDDRVSETIDLAAPNAVEKRFLQTGFGTQFSYDKLKSLSVPRQTMELSRAEENLNTALSRLLPQSINMKVKLNLATQPAHHLIVQLIDRHGGHTPLGVRGAGVRIILTVIGILLRIDLIEGYVLILWDEPEASLHPDSQHMLRQLLEALAARPTVQVIYATHSAAMINTMRGYSIRLLERLEVGGRASTIIHNQPVAQNFSLVRSSLGISPADSLLYGSVTLIVEGETEVIGLPLLLARLQKIEGFLDVARLLPLCHVIDGLGDSYEYVARLAKSQHAKPVVFLDGDKRRGTIERLTRDHPDIPVVQLDNLTDFEQVVPEDTYFAALDEWLHAEEVAAEQPITAENFHSWEEGANLHQSIMSSKRVDRWLLDTVHWKLNKPAVMRKAIESADPAQIKSEHFLELVRHIKTMVD